MISFLYRAILAMHPREFRERFAGDMFCTMEDARRERGAAMLLLDAFVSLLRQWIVRTHIWVFAAAFLGALVTIYTGSHVPIPVPNRTVAAQPQSVADRTCREPSRSTVLYG